MLLFLLTSAVAFTGYTQAAMHMELWSEGRVHGGGFDIDEIPSNTHITSARYSLKPPNLPCGSVPNGQEILSIWIGLQDAADDTMAVNFVQPMLLWGPNINKYYPMCNPQTWCASASTFVPGQAGHPTQKSAGFKPVPAGKTLDFELIVGTAVKQTIYIDGVVFSTQTDSPGMRPGIFNGANECLTDSCGTLPSYTWANLTVTLDRPYKDWHYMELFNAKTSGWQSPDGGKTWKNAGITLGQDSLYTDNKIRVC